GLDQSLLANDVDRGAPGGERRVALDGRRVQVGVLDERSPGTLIAHEGGQGHHTPAQGLGEGHDVGRDTVVIAAEHLPRASEPGLYLVDDQQRPHFVANRPQVGEVTVRWDDDPRFALYRLDDDCGRRVGDCIFDGLRVAV